MKHTNKILTALILGPLAAAILWLGSQPVTLRSVHAGPPPASNAEAEGYYVLVGTVPVWRTVTSGAAESNAFDTPIDAQPTGGNPTINLSATFSAAGATATVVCNLYTSATSGYLGTAFVGTLTASTIRTANSGRYTIDEVIGTDTRSAQWYDWRVTNVSSGTCQITGWTSGSSPTKAQ